LQSNEIVAIPELLGTLHLDGCIVTLDGTGCQKSIAERIRAKGADYLLGLKANHGRTFEAVHRAFRLTDISSTRTIKPRTKLSRTFEQGRSPGSGITGEADG
jgi:predicted transposase YbfD/YdcC